MSKSLLTAKIAGGAVLGTGAVAAGGYGIVEHFRSKESVSQETTPATSTETQQLPSSGSDSSSGNPTQESQKQQVSEVTQTTNQPPTEGGAQTEANQGRAAGTDGTNVTPSADTSGGSGTTVNTPAS